VSLLRARIDGLLAFSGVTIQNDSGPALAADGLSVDSDFFLAEGFQAVGVGKWGGVRLSGVHVRGQFGCSGRIHNDSGTALLADGIQVDGGMFLCDGFEAIGSGEDGAVRLVGARIGGALDCTGAAMRNGSGPALMATACG
jgi:hypothetical protein